MGQIGAKVTTFTTFGYHFGQQRMLRGQRFLYFSIHCLGPPTLSPPWLGELTRFGFHAAFLETKIHIRKRCEVVYIGAPVVCEQQDPSGLLAPPPMDATPINQVRTKVNPPGMCHPLLNMPPPPPTDAAVHGGGGAATYLGGVKSLVLNLIN